MLKVDSAWLPYENNKVMHFENEASVLVSRRSDICINERPSLSLGHFSDLKRKKNPTLYLILLRPFMEGACLGGFRETL